MPHFPRTRWVLLAAVCVAFALRLALAVGRGLGEPPAPGSDQFEYDNYAWNLAQGRGYRGVSPDVADQDHLTAYRMPGVSLAWAGLYKVAGHRYDVIRVFHCALGALTVLPVFYIGIRCFGRAAGLLAAGAYAVWPTAVFFSTELLSEPIATFCFIAFIAVSLRFAHDRSPYTAAAAGLLFGYAILVRPNAVFMFPLLLLWVVALFSQTPKSLARAALIPLVAVLLLVPWGVRNYLVFERFVPLSTMGGSALLMGNNRVVATDPRYYGCSIWDTRIPEYREALRSAGDEIARDKLAGRFAVEWLRENPDKWLFLAGVKTVRAWTPFLQPHSPLHFRLGMLLSWGPVLVLFAASFFPTAVRLFRGRHPGLLIHLAVLQFILGSLIFFGEARYRQAIEPLCLIWAAVTLLQLARWFRPALFTRGSAVTRRATPMTATT